MPVPTQADYVRGGPKDRPRLVHRRTCPALKGTRSYHGWPWANGKAPGQLRTELAADGETDQQTRFCPTCLPNLDPLPNKDD